MRSDLEKTVSKLHILEGENVTLQTNYQRMKDELIDARKKYSEAREAYMNTHSEKLETEKRYQSLVEWAKTQVTERAEYFEQIRDTLVPQDIDAVRIKVQEELEMPHRQKIQAMESDVESHRDQVRVRINS